MTTHATADAETSTWPRTVTVIGAAGLIGAGVVEGLALSDAADTICLTDLRENVLQAHAIDISEAQILAGTDRARLAVGEETAPDEVDLVIVAASAPETPDGDRRDFLRDNLQLLRKITPSIERLAGAEGIVMLLSNPVDILCEALRRTSSVTPDRIVGYSVNDSIRLRAAIGRVLGVSGARVGGLVLGEHGDGQVPLWDNITVDGAPYELDAEQRRLVQEDILGWFARWSALKPGRSSGWTTPRGVVADIGSMSAGTPHPACVWTGGIESVADSFITLPTVMEHGRIRPADDALAVSSEVRQGLEKAAESVAVAAADALADLPTA
ncbi:lactate/malate family dehydrogenase [Brevibacterium sp. H602]|uniref:lactate/malate family dehydrogenase n=1 Tax=unclassified Brevibacterium TaxID=2614124 RepID=UPI00397890BD